MGTGTVEARTKVTVSTKITGRISEILVDQGDRVTAGQVLVRLDDSDLGHQVEIEEANVAARKATVDRLIADKAYARAALDLATLSHTRAQRLSGQRVLSEEDRDRAVEGLGTARAAMDKAEAALAEGEKELVAAEKTLQFHQARLEDAIIIAPFDGLIARRDRDPGDVIVPGSSVLALVSLKEVWVTAWVDETEMARLEPRPGRADRLPIRAGIFVPREGHACRARGRSGDARAAPGRSPAELAGQLGGGAACRGLCRDRPGQRRGPAANRVAGPPRW